MHSSSGSSRQQSPLKWELGHPQPRPHLAHISTIAPVNFFSLNDNLSSGSVTWNRLYDPSGVGDTRLRVLTPGTLSPVSVSPRQPSSRVWWWHSARCYTRLPPLSHVTLSHWCHTRLPGPRSDHWLSRRENNCCYGTLPGRVSRVTCDAAGDSDDHDGVMRLRDSAGPGTRSATAASHQPKL